MSVSYAKVRGRIRARLQDADGRMDVPSGVAVDMAAASSWIALGAFMPAPLVYTASAFTIAAGSETFTLPVTITASGYGTGTVEYSGVQKIQLVSNGIYLRPASHEEIHRLRYGNVTTSTGIPQVYAMYQDGAQVVRGRCWPPPTAAEACNLWAFVSAEDLRDYVGTGGTEGMDTVTVPGTREQAQALEARTAWSLLNTMPKAQAEARGIDKAAKLAEWKDEWNSIVYSAEQRAHSLKSVGRVLRFKP